VNAVNGQFGYRLGCSCTLGRAVQYTANMPSAVYYREEMDPHDRKQRKKQVIEAEFTKNWGKHFL